MDGLFFRRIDCTDCCIMLENDGQYKMEKSNFGPIDSKILFRSGTAAAAAAAASTSILVTFDITTLNTMPGQLWYTIA